MKYLIIALIIYLILTNIIAYALMGIDKHKAKTGAWRIPEKTLFLSSIIGGSIGAIMGMYTFRHKTKHWYFKYGMPLILILHLVLATVILLHFYPI